MEHDTNTATSVLLIESALRLRDRSLHAILARLELVSRIRSELIRLKISSDPTQDLLTILTTGKGFGLAGRRIAEEAEYIEPDNDDDADDADDDDDRDGAYRESDEASEPSLPRKSKLLGGS